MIKGVFRALSNIGDGRFAKIVYDFAKHSILYVWQSFEYISDDYVQYNIRDALKFLSKIYDGTFSPKN